MSSGMLKILALLFMLIDHIGVYIPDMPVYLRWIGRISAPIFIFCSAWGFTYTSSKKNYLIRLYVASLLMAIIQVCIDIDMNFFRSLFSMCIIIFLIDSYRNKDEKFKKYLCFYLTWQIFSIAICIFLISTRWLSDYTIAYFFSAMFGNIFFLEGGLVFVCLGILINLAKDKKVALSIGYTCFCIAYFAVTVTSYLPLFLSKLYCWGLSFLFDPIEYILDTIVGISPMAVGGSMFFQNYQWMMIMALPFMLAYNKKRGIKIKYFFYIFYPVHIVILFYLGSMIYC
ncbi:TraX family protein [Desulfosporosinus meridiei]|uniref:TraX protein n=1 Tax=Desulfosporosinus meridiei (strain ATCC BAA-275 / DSM 13257 / KCTC 12902 / NCIMB 13706 / S10) TaxID=768704 RepID=J7IU56_DESMD|nr:TraX family protein [Desulfosporosinus meridiei]AFQ45255.1 TraX protein [Desulfosporosinus meridiei DSM 13257]